MKRIFSVYREFYKGNRFNISFYVFLLFLYRVSHFLFPITAAAVIDSAAYFYNMDIFISAVLMLALSGVVYAIVLPLRFYYEKKIEAGAFIFVVKNVISKIPFLKQDKSQEVSTGHIMQLISADADQTKNLAVTEIALISIEIVYTTAIIALLIHTHVFMALIVGIILIVFIIASKFFVPRLQSQHEKIVNEKDEINDLADETLNGLVAIKLSNAHDFIAKKINKITSVYYKSVVKYTKKEVTYEDAIVSGMLVAGTVFIYVLGAFFVIRGELTIGAITLIALFFNILWGTIQYLMIMLKEVGVNMVSVDRILNFSNLPVEKMDGEAIDEFRSLKVRNLYYSYADNVVFENAHLTINKGDKILLKGANGSGKSTLNKLLLGLISPSSGSISYNNTEISDLSLCSLRERVVLVPAEPYIFPGDLNEINFGRDYESSYFANTIFENMEYDGQSLSSGEKKRLQLLREIARSGDFYIFDEPLNFIDDANKKEAARLISEVLTDKTVIIISHEPGFFDFCNKRYELDNKSIIEIK